MAGGRISVRKPDPSSLRLYSAIMLMDFRGGVSAVWSGPGSDGASSLLEVSLIRCNRANTDSGGPSSQYLRTSASLALRTKTPMAGRAVDD